MFVSALVTISCISLYLDVAVAAPKPKAPWVQAAQSRLAKSGCSSNGLTKRWSNDSLCAKPVPQTVSAPKQNIWAGLADDEAASVTKWLFRQSELNLTTSDFAGEWDNAVLLVELMPPNKTDALTYMDSSGPSPVRCAHVVLDNRAILEATYSNILVGPLPVQNGATTWEPLEYTTTRKTGGSVRNLDARSDTQQAWVLTITGSVQDITTELWGGFANGSDADTLDVWGVDPLWQDEDGSGKLKLTYCRHMRHI